MWFKFKTQIEAEGKKIPVAEWLAMMNKTRHLLNPESSAALKEFQTEIDRRWSRLKAMAEHPLL